MKKVYKTNIIGILGEMSDIIYQKYVWLNKGGKPQMTISFIESANMLFDDSVISDLLEAGEIIFDKKTTQALKELEHAIDAVDEFHPEEQIIDSPEMEVVRQKAARALELVKVSDGSEGTVEIIG